MNTQKPGCLASILNLFRSGKKDDDISVQNIEPEKLPYRLRDDFLSPAEASFFQVLKTMIGDRLVICPKVSLAELFFIPRSESFQTYQNKIDRKRIDFLLCNPKTLKPAFAIELDDSSHELPNRQERDAFVEDVFATAELPLVRVPAQQAYNTNDLIALFQAATQKKQTKTPIIKQPVNSQTGPPLCPKCGVPMVIRMAKRGNTPGQQFYGCSNYPQCRVVIPLKSPVS
jgi:hypothetical protein